jgi:starvation-inducible DNA-binding protein
MRSSGPAREPLNQGDRFYQFDRSGAGAQRASIEAEEIEMSAEELLIIQTESLATPTDLGSDAVRDISGALNALLADMFALYLKTKNFHWHVSGPHFRDFHLLLDEQADQIFATTDPIAERVRKIGGTTIRSIGQIAAQKRLLDNDAGYVTPLDMLAELREDNKQLTAEMRRTHALCDDYKDVATASLIEVWIDEAERRTWFLFEATRRAEG